MKKQLDLFFLTFLTLLFNSFGRITIAFKGKMDADIFAIVALIMIITILSVNV
jgi:hypothetical protein